MTDPISLFTRVVVTKQQTYELAQDQTGRSAAEVFGEAEATRLGLLDAAIYDMPDGRRVITGQDVANGW